MQLYQPVPCHPVPGHTLANRSPIRAPVGGGQRDQTLAAGCLVLLLPAPRVERVGTREPVLLGEILAAPLA
jgi:hypothetical protein